VTRATRRRALLVGSILVAAAIELAAARGGGRGGGGRAGGGYYRGGAAAGGSLGQGRSPGGANRGGFSSQGPAASGSFAGRQPSGGVGSGGYVGGGQQIDRDALAQQQRERFGRLGPPEAADGRRQDQPAVGQEYTGQRREDWQDYAGDHDDGYPAHPVAAGVLVGAAAGAAAAAVATPPYWTLDCVPTTVVVGGITYYQCGSAWYVRAYSGGDVAYTMVNPPAGY